MPFVDAEDGTRLYYESAGSGRPVVLLCSVSMNVRMWEYQLPFLVGNGLRCVSYDRRGHGRSDWPWDGYDYDTLASDLSALLEQLDLRDVVLVGYAMGSGEAVRYLTRYGSDRIGALALVASTTPFLLKTPDNDGGVDPSALDDTLAGVAEDRPRFAAGLAPPFFGERPVSAELSQWFVGLSLDASWRATAESYRTLFCTDFRAEIGAVDVPTMVIHGDSDPFAPLDLCGRLTASAIPGSSLTVYEQASHGLLVTHAQQLNHDLLEFARSSAGTRPADLAAAGERNS